MRTLVFVAALLVAGVLTSFGAEAKKQIDPYETLRTTTIFAFGGVGVAATHVPAEAVFDEIVKKNDASAVFQRLLSAATPEGQLYALVGLSRIDHKTFLDVLPSYLHGTMEVNVARGCMLSKEPAKGIVAEIKAGDYK